MWATNQYFDKKLQERIFSLLVISILMTYEDQDCGILDRSSLYLIMYRDSLLCYWSKVLWERRELIFFPKIVISVPLLQALYIFIWVAKPILGYNGLSYMLYHLLKKKVFVWWSLKNNVSQCSPDWESSTKVTNPKTSKRCFSMSVKKHDWWLVP